MSENWNEYREKIIGLGELSSRKSYYPELQDKIEELQNTYQNISIILNSISDGIIIHNIEGKLLFLNNQARVLSNIKEEDTSKFTVMDLSPIKKNIEDFLPIWNEVLEGKPKVVEWEFCPIGAKNYIEVSISLTKSRLDNKDVIAAVIRDISEKKRFENLLKASEERLRKIFERSNDAIFIVDHNSKNFLNANHAAEILTGRTVEEIKNLTVNDIHPLRHSSFIHANAKEESLDFGEVVFKKPNGNERIALLSIRQIDENTSFGIAHDITERKLAEEKLAKQNIDLLKAIEKAKEMDRLKTIFFANMSHDLRTPLVGLLGFSEILEGELSGEFKEFAQKIHVGGQRLLSTLNSILKYSEIEAQKVNVYMEHLDLVKLLNDEIDLFRVYAIQKGIKLERNFENKVINIFSDDKLLRSICSNLINNALKYTLEGSVNVSIKENEELVQIEFSDTGIGIPKDKCSVIFEEFRQVSEGVNRLFDGTGLGLAIVKKYVQLLGATISIESEVNKGTTFIVSLPIVKNEGMTGQLESIAITEEEKIIEIKNSSSSVNNILVVDDELINLEVISLFLRDKYFVDKAETGSEAINKVKSTKYDLILMDINLKKEMDGLQATKIIRQIPGYENIPVVALTAFAMKGDKEEFLQAGCTHYLSKPFAKKQLMVLIESIINKQ